MQFKYKKVHFFLIAYIVICVCEVITVRIDGDFSFDLKFIPFVLGALYGGKHVASALAAALILIRIPMGGATLWLDIVLTIITTLIIIKVSPSYMEKKHSWKLLFTFMLSFGYSLITFLYVTLAYPLHDMTNHIIFGLTLIFSTFFVSYLLEILRTTYYLQLEAIKYEKMEIASHLAASISHEVRNPLTTVKGFLQLLLENKQIPQYEKKFISLSLEELNYTCNIIEDYLTFANPYPENATLFEIDEQVKKCTEALEQLATRNNIKIQTVFFHTGMVKGEPKKLYQALFNICKNAIESMPDGGSLSILTSTLNKRMIIKIIDTGSGMSPEQVARLGEPYFSINEQKGTGLGMMVVYRIIEGMGGTVKITSKVNIGTSVSLSLPSNN